MHILYIFMTQTQEKSALMQEREGDKQTNSLKSKTDIHRDRGRDRGTGRDRQTERQTDRETDRQKKRKRKRKMNVNCWLGSVLSTPVEPIILLYVP
jgi:hypothetical protein